MKIKLSQIVIPERHRQDYGDLEKLAASFRNLGQIQPILVTANPDNTWTLVAGGRRCAAAKLVPWDEIEAYDRANLTPLQRKELEYEENIRRKDTEWWEQCIAVAELHEMKMIEHGFASSTAVPDAWTQEKMAAFAGTSVGRLNYMLRLARLLKTTPKLNDKGEPNGVWAHATSYQDGVKYLIQLQEAEVSAEIERRRKLNAASTVAATAAIGDKPLQEVKPLSVGEVPLAESNFVYTHGTQKDFVLCTADEVTPLMSHLVLAYDPPEAAWSNIKTILRPNAYAVLWFSRFSAWQQWRHMIEGQAFSMDFPLIWNRLSSDEKTDWPFSPSISWGLVLTKGLHSQDDHPRSSVITANAEDDNLPTEVVNFSIQPFAAENMAVDIICGVSPRSVAELARVPIFYEGDAKAYEQMVNDLTAYYKETIPGIEVRQRS